ncbi:MAG: hypothetical protein AAFO69_11520 [Bacteroidota bacterium]
MKKKELIVQLIRQDLKHHKLISGLTKLGFEDDGAYQLDNHAIITKLMGLPKERVSDTWNEIYLSFMQDTQTIETQQMDIEIDRIADRCYKMLKSLVKIDQRIGSVH